MAAKVTAPTLREKRDKGERIVCVTAYDAAFSAMADEAGVDVVLVGDSLGNVLYGYPTTLPVSLEQMAMHTRAAAAGCHRALLVADLPFGSYQSSVEQAVDSAVALMKAGAEAVKLEGLHQGATEAILRAGIPVMGHVGMTPQSMNVFGGFKVQGRGDAGAAVVETARALDVLGVFAIVVELTPATLGARITEAVSCPTIGIGAGSGCSGQVQVLHDVLGFGRPMKHAKRYLEGRDAVVRALGEYAREVRAGVFPGEEHSF